jgi:hypothetical protein
VVGTSVLGVIDGAKYDVGAKVTHSVYPVLHTSVPSLYIVHRPSTEVCTHGPLVPAEHAQPGSETQGLMIKDGGQLRSLSGRARRRNEISASAKCASNNMEDRTKYVPCGTHPRGHALKTILNAPADWQMANGASSTKAHNVLQADLILSCLDREAATHRGKITEIVSRS